MTVRKTIETRSSLRRRARRGVAAVEAAVTLPLLITLLLGLWEVGRMLQINATMNNAVREGARMAAGGLYNGQPVTVAMVQTQVKDYLTAGGFPAAAVNGSVVTVTNLSAHNWTDPSEATPLDRFRVTVTIPSGSPYQSLQWSPVSTMTGRTSLAVTTDWLSANDSRVTVDAQLPY